MTQNSLAHINNIYTVKEVILLMLNSDVTKGTISGVWRGIDLDKPYSFTNDKGKLFSGVSSFIYIQGLTRGKRSELFKIRVPESLKNQLPSLNTKNNDKNVTLTVEIGYSFGKFTITLAE